MSSNVSNFDLKSNVTPPLQDIAIESPTQDNLVVHEEQTQDPQEPMLHEPVPLQRSTRERRNAISDDYVLFLQEHEKNNGMMEDDPVNFHQAMQDSNLEKWIEAMNEEYKSMQDNKVWELVPLPEGVKPIDCKWIFKTKQDSNGNIEGKRVDFV